jgi:hypothetical protein
MGSSRGKVNNGRKRPEARAHTHNVRRRDGAAAKVVGDNSGRDWENPVGVSWKQTPCKL